MLPRICTALLPASLLKTFLPQPPRRVAARKLAIALAVVALWTLVVAESSAQSVVHFAGTTPVATAADLQHVPVTVTKAGQVSSVRVLTQGSQMADFIDAGTGSCVPTPYNAGANCTVDVVFKPTTPGRRAGAVVLVGASGEVLGSQLIDAMATGSLAVIQPGIISTVAGSGEWVFRTDGVDANSAQIFLPNGVVKTVNGDLLIADSGNNRIRRVDGSTNLISTYAGIGSPASSGDGGLATAAGINSPSGLALDGAGNLYFADTGNSTVRRIDGITHIITTVAGVLGTPGYSGDNGPATSATLNTPTGIAFDADGNLYIGDSANNAVRRVDAITHKITTVAGGNGAGSTGDNGPATSALLNGPSYLTFGPDGLLYFSDGANNVVRRVDASGIITTVAGTQGTRGYTGDGGPATKATMHGPSGILFDPAGNLYIADSVNARIRRVESTTGVITSIAGTDSVADLGDGGLATLGSLSGPTPLFMDGTGNLLIGDLFHNIVRSISATTATMQFPVMKVTKTSAPYGLLVENNGNAPLTLGTPVFAQSALDKTTSNCTATPMNPGAVCTLGVEFAPTVVGNLVSGTLTYPSSASNSPIVVTPYGQVLSVEPSTVVLVPSVNPAAPGQAVVLTATVSSATSRTGAVTFLDGTTTLGTANINTSGVATMTISTLSLGQHSLTASYAGDANNASSVSAAVTENIRQSTSIAITSSLNPSTVTQSVTFTAVLKGSSSPITSGSMDFLDGATTIGSGNIGEDGSATFTTTTLAAANHAITAKFAGDTNSLASQSAAISQVVNHASTTTLLSVNPGTINVGDAATLSATVTSNGGPQATGTITFKSGSTILGTATLKDGGASFQTAGLLPGTDAITAVYAGDDSNATSTSATMNILVNRLATTTMLATSNATSNAGTSVQLSATVTLSPGLQADGALTGTVTFNDGTNIIGTAPLASNGVATLATSTLTVGNHTLTASYSGATNYANSTSANYIQTVKESSSTTAMSVSSSSVIAGKALTLSANVTTQGVAATGSITFSDGTTTLGTGLLTAGATSVTLTNVSVGTHAIVATYSGDVNYSTSKSAATTVTVSKGQTTLALVPSGNTLTAGSTLNLTATLTTNGVINNNTVITLTDGANVLGALTANNAGVATYSTSTLAVGNHTLTATFAGDAGNDSATSTTITIAISQAKSTTVLTSSASPAVYGTAVNFQAAVTSAAASITGNVTFQEGATILGTVPVNNAGIATLPISNLSVGAHTITAVYAGDVSHSTSNSNALSQSIIDTTSVSLASTANPAIAGRNIQWTATVVPANNVAVSAPPTGSVTFSDGSVVLATVPVSANGTATVQASTLTVGTHMMSAKYTGDSLYQASTSAVESQVVNGATTTTALTVGANPATYGSSLSMRAVVTGTGGIPTGSVSFMDGTTVIGQGTLGADGTVSWSTTSLQPGTHTVTVKYAGDASNNATVSPAVPVQVLQTTKTSISTNANPAMTMQDVVLSATVVNAVKPSATGTVVFSDGSAVLATVPVDGNGVATMPAQHFSAGTHIITAVYSGDGMDFTSTAGATPITVQLRSTSNALTAAAPQGGTISLISVLQYNGPTIPTGTTTFTSGGNILGTSRLDASGVATLSIPSTAVPQTITATYSGDSVYSTSNSTVNSISTTSSDATNFTIAINPTTVSMQSMKYVKTTVTLKSVGGFADTLQLGCLGLPYAATCTFDKDSIALAANGTAVVNLTIDTGSPLTSGGQATAKVENSGSNTMLMAGLPAGALVGFLLLGSKRKRYGALLLMLVLFGSLLPMTGCGTIQINGTPAGNYTIQISAAGQKSNTTVTQGVAMTVTK